MDVTGNISKPNRVASVRSGGVVEVTLAALVFVGVLAQAALAGQHIAFESSITLHGVIGNAVFAFQAILVASAVFKKMSSEAKLIVAAMLVLLAAQTGLGYAGREAEGLVAWHIPLGVALFGLATLQLARIRS